jgi:hypothetical protein
MWLPVLECLPCKCGEAVSSNLCTANKKQIRTTSFRVFGYCETEVSWNYYMKKDECNDTEDEVYRQLSWHGILWRMMGIRQSCTWTPDWVQQTDWRFITCEFFFHLFISAYNVWAISPTYLLPPPSTPHSLPLPPYRLTSRQKLFCPYL